MPAIKVLLFREDDGTVPLLQWLDELGDPKAVAKCRVRMELLSKTGSSRRRPQAGFLRDGIYELRVRVGNKQLRLLYFFHGQAAAIVSHGIIKRTGAVDPKEIDGAVERRAKFKKQPARHTYEEPAHGEEE